VNFRPSKPYALIEQAYSATIMRTRNEGAASLRPYSDLATSRRLGLKVERLDPKPLGD
jgi:hypothetical protein